jgi:hypothetical protein
MRALSEVLGSAGFAGAGGEIEPPQTRSVGFDVRFC